jgi:hypothetical protein
MIKDLLQKLAKLSGPVGVEIFDLVAEAEKILATIAADEALVAAGVPVYQKVQDLQIGATKVEFGVYAKKAV